MTANGRAGWPRFWYPSNGNINFDQRGYVLDPERTELWRSVNPDLVPFDVIGGKRILGLLGEPGSGKSYALRAEFRGVLATAPGRAKLIDLKEYGDESRLIRDAFEGDWINAEGERHLFLDSLDEGLIRIETLSSVVVKQLERLPQAGLFIRIACRTAEWPRSLEQGIEELAREGLGTGEAVGDQYGSYVLAPLRRRDIGQAAVDADLEAEPFLEWIERIPAVPLAIKPLTLSLLIAAFKAHDKPVSQVDLYNRGCRYLVEESDPIRRERRRQPSMTTAERLAAAELCAAALILGGRRAIWREPDLGQVPPDDIVLDEIVEQSKAVGSTFTVGQLAHLLTSTGLFTTRGRVEEVAFAHQTYAEYLAAHFLVDRLSLTQLLEVFTQGDAQLVVPQLRETAAWVAQLRDDFYDVLLERDPKVLLRSNVATADHKRRKDLVDALLRLYAEGRLFDDWDARHYYALLAHPGLANQIRPVILDANQPLTVRAGAVALAEVNTLDELGPELLRVALDPGIDLNLRIDAAHAVARRGSRTIREQMRPLLHDERDRDRELRGYALRALWPDHLSARELFAELQPEGDVRLFGAYKGFLLFDLVASLNDEDLIEALHWIRDLSQSDRGFPFHYDGLADRIVARAAPLVEEDVIRRALCDALIARQRHRHEMVSERDSWSALADPSLRRAIAATAVAVDDVETIPYELVNGKPPLLWSADREWMLEQGLSATDPELALRWARVLEMFMPSEEQSFLSQVYYATERSAPFAEVFRGYFSPIELDSDSAKFLRRQRSQSTKRRPLLDPSPTARIEAALSAIEAGDIRQWWILNREMTLDIDSTHYEFSRLFEPDLRKFIGWKEAPEPVRARVLAAARRVVLDYVPGPPDWLGSDIFREADFAGYRAFALLQAEDRRFLEGLAPEIWERWALVLAGYPAFGENDVAQRELLEFALPHATAELVRAFEILLAKDCRKHDHPFFLRSIPEAGNPHIADMLMRLATAHGTKPACAGALLERLFAMKDARAVDWANQRIRRPGPAKSRQRQIAVHAGRALLMSEPTRTWPLVWRAINRIPDYGHDLFLSMADVWDRKDWLASLTEFETADLYVWLEREFPHHEDPPREGAVPPRAEVAELRDRLVQRLGNRGTTDAVAALRKVRETFDGVEYRWIDRLIVAASDLAAASSWTPLDLKGLAALIGDPRRHLVESERALQDAVVESLGRLETELHDETPAVVDLWELARGRVRPKDEVSLSNYVKRFLKRDLRQHGIATNREVEIADTPAKGAGQLLDLRVDAARDARDDRFDVVSVFVEVKASWSSDLIQAMRTQLAERYLQDTTVRHGIYLVGWFASSRWDSRDRRKALSERRLLDQVRSELSSQAERLSGAHLRVVPVVLDLSLHDEGAGGRDQPVPRARRRTAQRTPSTVQRV